MTRVNGESALVLHTRPYRESSAIVTLLTASHGRIAAVARGARGNRRGNVLQPFNQLRVSWTGRGAMVTLAGYELTRPAWLTGNRLAGGFYVLELLNRLLVEHESLPRVYAGASWTLQQLEAPEAPLEVLLREFERLLLEELGYGLDFAHAADSGDDLDPAGSYSLQPDLGFVTERGERGFRGDTLLAIGRSDYRQRPVRIAAKKIFREALRPLLGPRPLASRRLLSRRRA